jgi:transcriptional regulator GlxA family with amidase domain
MNICQVLPWSAAVSLEPSIPPQRVLLLVFDNFQLLDACGPLEVFAAVNERLLAAGQPPRYALQLVSEAGGAVRASAGVSLLTEPLPVAESLAGATLLVAGGFGVMVALAGGRLAPWLRQAEAHLARCGSVCTGAFLLGQAGLLDGRAAVTHWRYAALLARSFPRARVCADALFVKDGHCYSSAGVSAGIDLCLALVEEDCGRDMALQVAKDLVLPLRRGGGQRQFSAELLAQAGAPGGIGECLAAWLRPRLQQALTVGDMAQALALSMRTLHRRCREELQLAPAQLLQQLRLEAACRLLEQESRSLKRVAERCGFASLYNLRRCFVQQLGVTPAEYRQRFCRS